MIKDQIEQKIAELHEKVFALQKEIDEVEREAVNMKDEEGWPNVFDDYWCISSDGKAECVDFDDDDFDKGVMSIGNMFRKKCSAEFAVERLKVLAEIRKFAFEPIKNQKTVCLIAYSYYDHQICIDRTIYNFGNPCFNDEETAQACIDAIGEERLKKYYFGVKDDE